MFFLLKSDFCRGGSLHSPIKFTRCYRLRIDNFLGDENLTLLADLNCFVRCIVCANEAISSMPSYLQRQLDTFYDSLNDCEAPWYFIENPFEPYDDFSTSKEKDGLCKLKKIASLDRMMKSISDRVEAWVAYIEQNPSV